MVFSEPRVLLALVALPLVLLAEWWAARRAARALDRLVGSRDDHSLLAQRRADERWVGAVLRLAALALLVLGAARPEWGREVVRRGATGSDVVLVVDVSASMDARDVPPSRIDEARREALAVLDRLGGSRVGVVAFAGDAVRLCPLTLDRGAARLVLEALSSGSISTPGSDIGRGLRMALKVLPGGRREEQAIVLWTDGEDLERGARDAIEEVARAGVRVFTVGVGTPAGDVVPILDADGRATDVKHDESGAIVRSRLDEALLRLLARRSGGAYFSAGRPGGELPRLLSAIGTVARAGRGQRLIERPVARFPLLAGLAALLLVLERARARRRREAWAQGTPVHSERGAAAAAVALLLLTPWGQAQAQSDWARGDRAFKAGRFAEAESLYARRMKKSAPPEVRVNRAVARALKGDADGAGEDLERLTARDGRVGREAGYNLGTLLGQKNRVDPALDALRRVMERDAKDEDARWNYEVLMRQKQQQEKSPSPQRQPPSPSPSPTPSSGGGGSGNPSPAPSQGTQGQNAPQGGAPNRGGSSAGMNRTQAEQLLGALQEMARIEQQRRRKVQVMRDRQARDW